MGALGEKDIDAQRPNEGQAAALGSLDRLPYSMEGIDSIAVEAALY